MRWSGQTGGTQWMQRTLVVLFKYIDIRIIYAIMSFWLLWYVIVRPSATKAIFQFHRKRRNRSVIAACLDTYCSYFHFGQAIMDRFAVYAGYQFHIEVPQMEEFRKHRDGEEGFIVLFSHFGNSEMAGYSMATPQKRMNIVLYMGDTETINQNRSKVMAKNNLRLIPMRSNDMGHVFTITEALNNGEIVAMAVDRIVQSKGVPCTFMQDNALFPIGPFRICSTMQKTVLSVFVLKESWNSYKIIVEPLNIPSSLPKRQQAEYMAQQYVMGLEKLVMQYPYQWFNFYDFWAKEND